MYVAGNPSMFIQAISCAVNPMSRSDALASAQKVANNGGGWRVWVERGENGERIFESAAEKDHQAARLAKRLEKGVPGTAWRDCA